MKAKDYTAQITVKATATEVYKGINDILKWWSDDLKGNSQKVNDEFTVRFGDIHVSTQKVTELIPNSKITWLVTDSNLNFIKDKSEWNNTTITFDIEEAGKETIIHFTHHGLVPEIECYNSCSKGWDYYFKGSLFKLFNEGKGTPGL